MSIPCKFCGHGKEDHYPTGRLTDIKDCIICRDEMDIWGNSKVSIYHRYQLDNLRYLEECYESKSTI